MSDPLRHHRAHRREGDFGDGFAQRLANRIAEGIGTTTFLTVALGLIVAWIIVNGAYGYLSGAVAQLEHGKPFDAPPWVLLNLIFSFEAFFTGSLVVIAQKAQAKRDRAREEAEANHREEIAEAHTTMLTANTALTQKVHELTEAVHVHLLGS